MEEIDLRELIRMFWNKKLEIILIVAVFALAGIIYTLGFVSPVYSSSTKLLLASSNSNKMDTTSITTMDVTLNSKLVSTYSVVVESENVLSKVISNLNINIDEDALRKSVKVTSVKDTEVIEITVTNADKDLAARIANEIANVFIDTIKDIYNIENVQILDVAKVENTPSNINHRRDVLMFAGVGVVVSAAYDLIANMLDTTIKSAEDIESMYQLPVLASIPVYEENTTKNKKGGRK